jgi:lipid-A-disaccharide synthase
MISTSKTQNCFVLAGELSGEEHAQTFLPQVIERYPHFHFWGVGGEYFRQLGIELHYSIKDFSSMGFTDVIKKFSFYKEARKKIIDLITERKTPVAILIDFQGFNMSLLKPLFEKNVKVLYFVAPQAWAWKSWRTKYLQNYVTKLYCILPFEEKWFKERGVLQAETVAHPSYFRLQKSEQEMRVGVEAKKLIVWLPGSRKGEIEIHWPIFLKVLQRVQEEFPHFQHAVVVSPAFKQLEFSIPENLSLKYFEAEELFSVLKNAHVAIAASGTVTLNCAFAKVATIVCYRVNLINAWIFRSFILYKGFVSLANLLLNKKVYPELLQEECHPKLIFLTLKKWLENPAMVRDVELELEKLNDMQNKLPQSAFASMNEVFKAVEV